MSSLYTVLKMIFIQLKCSSVWTKLHDIWVAVFQNPDVQKQHLHHLVLEKL